MAVAPGDTSPPRHEQRLLRTREILAAAASSSDQHRRRILLLEAAALNAEAALSIVSSLSRRYAHGPAEEEKLMAWGSRAYLRAVLAVDAAQATDLLSEVLPALRETVVAFGRGHEPSP